MVSKSEKPIHRCKLGILSRPDGSAMYSEDFTTVITGIYGPIESKQSKISIEKLTIETNFRSKGFPVIKDRLNESIIKNICENAFTIALYPGASITVNIQELHNSGHLLSSAINATCMAALDSGVDMKCMFAAVSCFINLENEFLYLAPTTEDEIKGLFVFVFDSVEGKVIGSYTEGCFTTEQYEEALDICKIESINIFNFFKKTLKKYVIIN